MLHEHLTHDLPAYEVTRRPVKIYKEGAYWTWDHHCLHRSWSTPVNGYPEETHARALELALAHWRRC